MTRPISPLGQILADTARDLAYAYRDGKPLGPVEVEAAARIAAHYKHGLCKGGCGETVLFPRDLCNRCYRDAKGPFSFGGESDE